MGQHSASEYRLTMGVLSAVCVIGAASAVFPLVEHAAGVGFGVLFGLLVLAGLVYVGRELLRDLRFRAEMRALDRRDAARLTQPAPAAPQRSGGVQR